MLEKILQAFDLARRPFGAMPDPKCFFTTDTLQETLDTLVANIERGQGIGIVTGDAGIGKSLLCERLLMELTDRFEVVLLRHAKYQSSRAVLQEILSELGGEFEGLDETELRLAIRRRVQAIRPRHAALVVIIDEADNFPSEALEELRILADLAQDGTPIARLVLCGQWRLEERLTEREFDALNQRVSAHAALQSLSTSESVDYVRFRLNWAGGNTDSIFSESALRCVVRAAGGVPRCLNLLADHCLYLARDRYERPIEAETVRQALADLKRLPLHWNDLHDLATLAVNDDETLFEVSVDDTVFGLSATGTESPSTETDLSVGNELPLAPIAETASSCFEFGAEDQSLLDAELELMSDSASATIEIGSTPTLASPVSEAIVFEFGAEMALRVDDEIGATADVHTTPMAAVDAAPANVSQLISSSTDSSNGCCFTITAPQRSRTTPLVDDIEKSAQPAMNVMIGDGTSRLSPTSGDVDHHSALSCDESAPDTLNILSEAALDASEPVAESADSAFNDECCLTLKAPPRRQSLSSLLGHTCSTMLSYSKPGEFGHVENVPQETQQAVIEPTTTLIEPCHAPRSLGAEATSPSLEQHSDNSRSLWPEKSFTHEEHPVPQFVEEIVLDHYAALQEPEFSGIIWNLAQQTSGDLPSIVEQVPPKATIDERDLLIDEPPRITLEFEEAVRRRDAAASVQRPDRRVEPQKADIERHLASEDLSSSDVVEDVRPLQPSHYLDVIMPLIDEAIDGEDILPDATSRSREEIEAELIDVLTSGEPGTEDLIGSEVLDLCLDAQAAIQQAQDAVAQSLQNQLSAIDPDDDDPVFEQSLHAHFDVVEPEDDSELSATEKSERRMEGLRESQRRDEQRSDPQDQARRPFSRLFSELRRRQRLVG